MAVDFPQPTAPVKKSFFMSLGAVGTALGVEHIQAVGHGVDDRQDVLGGCLLAAGEGDDQLILNNRQPRPSPGMAAGVKNASTHNASAARN